MGSTSKRGIRVCREKLNEPCPIDMRVGVPVCQEQERSRGEGRLGDGEKKVCIADY